MADERIEQARKVLTGFEPRPEWTEVDEDMPPALRSLYLEQTDAFRRADVEWILEHTHPDVQIVPPAEIPGAHTHVGRSGMLDNLLDWPRQWRNLSVIPHRIFAVGDDHVVIAATHRGRARGVDIEVEAEIVWLMQWTDGLLRRWDMFMSVDEARETARSRLPAT